MKLHTRLALAALLATVPVALALVVFDSHERRRTAEGILAEHASWRLREHREVCEQNPSAWGGELPPGPPGRPRSERRPIDGQGPGGPPPGEERRGRRPGPPMMGGGHAPAQFYAYDESLHSAHVQAPTLKPSLLDDLSTSNTVALSEPLGSSLVEVLVRSSWGTGPCAIVYARGSTDPMWGAVLPRTWVWVLPVVAVFGAMLLAVWPVVLRIRGLRDAVRNSMTPGPQASSIPLGGDDEVAELAHAFEDARRDIAIRAKERDEREQNLRNFLANTTHDVMTPMTVLLGHLSSLRAATLPEDSTRVVGEAMNEVQYMTSLLQNLATVARLEGSDAPVSRARASLNGLVERVVARHRPAAKGRGVALDFAVPEAPVLAHADITLLEQAVGNLVHNAVRYNHEHGHVAVVLATEGDRFEMRVIDDGPGIAEQDIARLRARGVRGDEARTRAPEGQGLGLSIAFRVAEEHGYTLELTPGPEGGLEAILRGHTV